MTADEILAELGDKGYKVNLVRLQEQRWPDGFCTVGWKVDVERNKLSISLRAGTREEVVQQLGALFL